jgi:dipeptidyl aminopeptidase/acylaminoacyl peptidase
MKSSCFAAARAGVAILLVVFLVGTAVAQQTAGALRPLRLADYYDLVALGGLTIAPDGSRVVFTRTDIDVAADRRVTSIWSMGIDGEDPHQLVDAGAAPSFAPDGRTLGYLNEGQVWILSFGGGEPWQLTGLPGGVRAFSWSPDGRSVVVVSQEAAEAPPQLLPADQLPMAGEELASDAAAPALEPLDAGDWVPSDPAVAAPAAGGADTDPDAEVPAEPLAPYIPVGGDAGYPVGATLEPAAEAADATDALPRVLTRLQFKADGAGYVGTRPQHLFVVDLPASAGLVAARRITGGRFTDGAPRWSPDGRWIAFSSNRTDDPDLNLNTDVWLVTPRGGPVLRVTESPGADDAPRWSSDSTHLVYRHVPRDPVMYANPRLRLVALGAPAAGAMALEVGAPVDLTAGLDRPLGSDFDWAHDRATVFATMQDRGMVALVQVSTGLSRLEPARRGRRRSAPNTPAGTAAAIVAGPSTVHQFEVLPGGGGALAILSSGTGPTEIYRVPLNPRPGAVPMRDPAGHVNPTSVPAPAELRPLTDFNGSWRRRVELASPEPLRFHSTDEMVIEGWLLRPPGYQEGIRYPLIVDIHGGPVTQFSWAFSWQHQWLAAQGYAVLYLNPRGSSGYGEDFAEAVAADWGGPDSEDILAGVDHLVGRGIVHPDRIGVGGWSYGGVLTNYLVTRTERFAAAVSGASLTGYFAAYGTDDLQHMWESEFGLPYEFESRAAYDALSPIYDVAKIETPTLFMVGEEDARIAASQSEQMYAQLRRRMVDGGPATGLIVYPGQGHAISRPSFVVDRWLRYRAWYDRYLKNDASADPFFGLRAW